MKKIVSPLAINGAPWSNDYLLYIQDELYKIVEGLLAGVVPSGSVGDVGIIISGLDITYSAPNFTSIPGLVYLNGQFMAVTNTLTGVTGPLYIVPSSVALTTDIWADGSTNNFVTDQSATITTIAPGSGQYILITATGNLGAPGGRRIEHFINKGIYKPTFTTASAGALETAVTLPRTANKTTRYIVEMVATRVSGADAAGSACVRTVSIGIKDIAGAGTALTATTIESQSNAAGAPALTIAVSGANTVIQVQPGSATSYVCQFSIKTMEV